MPIKNILHFINELKINNNREWFANNKSWYDQVRLEFEQLSKDLIIEISKFDQEIKNLEVKDCVFRIYRDTRFSHDKTPYKTHFGVFIASFAKSRQQVQSLSILIVLIMSCIGGSMVPIFMMPPFMQKISVFSVNYWGIQGFYDIFWRMLPLTDITFLTRVLVLLLIGTSLNVTALQLFKRNILKIA